MAPMNVNRKHRLGEGPGDGCVEGAGSHLWERVSRGCRLG